MLLLLAACLFDRAAYEARLRELTDADGDGYALEVDCDDEDATVSPVAAETCDGRDEDCDGEVDDGLGAVPERCNDLDDDCDGEVDDDATDATTWYNDADGDGFGLAAAYVLSCTAPGGFVADPTDCDDGSAARHPGAAEVAYDGIDQDCDGADLVDRDGDGYPAQVAGGLDCDDDDAAVHPSADETWDNGFVDNDCDGAAEGGWLEFGTQVFVGRTDDAHAGGAITPLGDLDSDGRAEFAVSAFYDQAASPGAGAVHLVTGGDPLPMSEFPTVEGRPRDWLGSGLDAVDADRDGHLDLVVSATGADDGAGVVFLILASDVPTTGATSIDSVATTRISGPHAGAYFGAQVRDAGDLDGDGLTEIAIAAPVASWEGLEGAGTVWIFAAESLSEGTTAGADAEYHGDEAWELAGNGVQRGGDQDDDGRDDLIVFDGIDDLWLIAGGSASGALDTQALVRVADAVGDCRIVGDLDADRRPDLVLLGPAPYVLTDLTAQPTWTRDDASATVSLGGDTLSDTIDLDDQDGDGAPELALFSMERAATGTGWVGIVPSSMWSFGADVLVDDLDLQALATRPHAGFGYRAANVGDVTGTDTEHFAVGGWLDDEAGTDAGAVALLPIPQR